MITVFGVRLTMAALVLVSPLVAGDAPTALGRADEALAKGDYDTAISHYNEAIRLDAQFARPYHGRGVAYFHKEQYDKAIASYSEAIRLEPKNDVALFDRGLARWRNGEPKQALEDFTRAATLNPNNDSAHNGRAWVLATTTRAELRDGKRAVEAAKKACELTGWKNPLHLSALAAAYAETGDFGKAVDWHKKAMASPDFPADKVERARERLKLYERRKPYRDSYEKK